MGLDIVELVMAVEDEFEVEVPDSFGEIRTVGNLHDTICQQLEAFREQIQDKACTSFLPFFATRDALLEVCQADSRQIRPSRRLADLIARPDRRAHWEQIQVETGIRLPSLRMPATNRSGVQFMALLVLVFTSLFCVSKFGADIIVLVLIATPFLVFACYLATRPLANAFPDSCQTVGDVVRHARQPSQNSEWVNNPKAVWPKLVSIVSEQLDAPQSLVTRDARFIEDLKCG